MQQVPTFPIVRQGANLRVADYESLFNGSIWLLKPDEDYRADAKTAAVIRALHVIATRSGIKIKTRSGPDGIHVQCVGKRDAAPAQGASTAA